MANFGRSFKPTFPSSWAMRPGMSRPALSSCSSVSSADSPSSRPDEPFVFSASNTPAQEKNAPSVRGPTGGGDGGGGGGGGGGTAATSTTASAGVTKDRLLTTTQNEVFQDQPAGNIARTNSSESSKLSRSKPIAIELPPVIRKTNTAPVYTPPEPLSARGDIPGGYFPFHEDPNSRVYRPHPFHLDAKKARHRSISQAAESVRQQHQGFLDSDTMIAKMPEQLQVPLSNPLGSAGSSLSHTPVSSYLPIGVNENALPMGKYYPSNYEKRNKNGNSSSGSGSGNGNGSRRQQRTTARPTVTAPSHTRSEPQVPKHRGADTSHIRTDSDVKRRLQQYQRDMIAQATLAASAVIGDSVRRQQQQQQQQGSSASGGSYLASPTTLHSIQLSGSIIRSSRPISPRLLPLGSPGPVTPMNLEGEAGDGADGYLGLGLALRDPDAVWQTEEVARAIRAEEERRRREDSGSPVVELGPI